MADNKDNTDGSISKDSAVVQGAAATALLTSQSTSSLVKSSEASTVHLYNVPAHVTDGYLLDLCSRWGSVASIARQMSMLEKGGLEIVVVYNQPVKAQEALRHLDGGNLFGSSLRAQLRSALLSQHIESFFKPLSPQELATQAAGGPRNLYVLNLSLEMTNQELERLFSVFGQVTHVCIMAVLDSVGRRRAFVDMATGESARQALQALSGTFIQGYKLDVSFAIIQRSGGPVTDYPPTLRKRAQQASLHLTKNPQASASAFLRTQLQLQAASASVSPSLSSASSPYSSPEMMMMQHNMIPQHAQITASPQLGPSDGAMVPYNPSPQMFPNQMQFMPPPPMMMNYEMQTPSKQLELYVSNLDPVAILDDEDLANLFKPYGTVLNSHLALDQNGTSLGIGVVKMLNPAEAEFARTHVQGRVMDGRRISVTFSPPAGAPFGMSSNHMPYGNHMNSTLPYANASMQSSYISNLNTLVNSYNGHNVPLHLQQQVAALAGSMGGLGIFDPTSSTSSAGVPFMPNGQPTQFNHNQNYYNQQQYFNPYMSTPKRFQQYNNAGNTSTFPINPPHYNPYNRHSSPPEDVLDQSTATATTASTHEHNNSGFSTIHSREGSVETSATTAPSTAGSGGSSLDIKIEEDDIVNTGGLKSRSVSFDPSTLEYDDKKNSGARRLARSVPVSSAAGVKSAPSSPENKGGMDGRSRSNTTEGLVRNPRSRQASKMTLLRSVTEGIMEEPEHQDIQQSVGGRSLYNSRGGLTRSQSAGDHQA